MKKLLKSLGLVIFLPGCITTMSVKVDILDRYAVEQSDEYKYFMAQKNALPDFNDTSVSGPIKRQVIASYNTTLAKASVGISPSALNNLVGGVMDSLGKLSGAGRLKISNINQSASSLVNNALSGLVPDSSLKNPQVIAGRDTLQSALTKSVDQAVEYGTSIAGDPLASLVAKVPESYWRKYKKKIDIEKVGKEDRSVKAVKAARVNKTKVVTFFGNADIAIKMDAPTYFVVKGVRLDADQAVKASFAVLNQGIKYFAYSKGIAVQNPASSSSTGTSNSALPQLQKRDSLQAQAVKVGENNTAALGGFLNIIFSQKNTLMASQPADTGKIRLAVGIIQNAFSVYKQQVQ